ERTELPGAGREQVLREEVRRGDRRAAGGDGEGQRARGDLLAVAVRRQDDVRGGQHVGQFGDGEKAIVELDVIGDSEVERATLEQESILLALQPRYFGVRPPRDEVQHLGMTRDDPRQGRNRGLDPLPRRDEPERREHKPRSETVEDTWRRRAVGVLATEKGRRPMLDDAYLVRGAA